MSRINVTKTFLPPLSEYQDYLARIWESAQLTNQGPLLKEFEAAASDYLGVNNLHFVNNGTMALQVAIRALGITEGQIITTPFTYVATSSAILWEHCEPVFVDIDPETLCIDPAKIEAAITSKTKAILPVHVFGNPCDIEQIDKIAKTHGLKVIYDAAHAFGVNYKGKSLLDQGDISICSFHATKLFHTIEGGCIIAKDKKVSDKIELMKRFGHEGDDHKMLGVNAKATEFNAAMGLCNLKYVGELITKRGSVSEQYDKQLSGYTRPTMRPDTEYNFAYYPILLDDESKLQKTIKALEEAEIFPRRYFYPSLNKLPYVKPGQSCPVSERVASVILCLPLYADLAKEDVNKITKIVREING